MENKEKEEATPLEFVTSILLDYRNVLSRTLNDYPNDENISKFVCLYEEAVTEFKDAVTSDEIVNDYKIQTVLLAMDMVSEKNRSILINSISNFIDLINDNQNDENNPVLKKILGIYCMLVDIYSEVDEKLTCKVLMSEIIDSGTKFAEDIIEEQEKIKNEKPDAFDQKSYDFGLSYKELTKVVGAVIQEEMKNSDDSINFVFNAYEKMNSIEKEFFMDQILNGFIDGKESEIIRVQAEGKKVDSDVENLLIGARQLLWKIQKKFKAY